LSSPAGADPPYTGLILFVGAKVTSAGHLQLSAECIGVGQRCLGSGASSQTEP
jgi:hypothetical protein